VGGILVGERTHASTTDSVSYRPLEPLSLKGKAEPVSAWEPTGLRTAERGGESPAAHTPFVGRADELGQLERAFSRATREGAPHIVTVIGHAGVGKTRLLSEFKRSLQTAARAAVVRHGRCLAFGSTGVYWPLSEMLRVECGILDDDTATAAWSKLQERLGPPLAALEGPEEADRRLVALSRLVGAEPPEELAWGDQGDEQAAREAFFGAVRTVFEALADDGPVVLAWEDIHWADDGTLDLIEYLSLWLRAPVLQVCLARDELLERRAGWSNPRRSATVMFLEALAPAETQQLIESVLQRTAASTELLDSLAERSGGNPLFAETIAQRIVEQGDVHEAELPDTVQGLLAARIDSLEPDERELVTHASVLGRTFWESALEPVAARAGVELESVLRALRTKDIIVLGERAAQGEERELAFKHVLIRDVAYGMLPKAVRARKHAEAGEFIEEQAGEREGIAALLAEHYGLAAGLATEARFDSSEIGRLRAKATRFGESAGDTAAALYSNAEALTYYQAAEASADDPAARSRLAEKRGDIALRLGRVDTALECWAPCLEYWGAQDDLEHVAELHRKVGAALAHKGERSQAIEHLQQGINLIKERPPSLALVRLYEEAAWLYMQAGDNMLAIYASEKALRLAEQLGAVGAASRTHGIFGRIFGRIGDIGRARQNLERAVELARESDAAEAAVALLTLGHHLEQFEGDYESAQSRYSEGLAVAEQIGDVPAQIELQSAVAQLAFYRCEWDEVRRASDQSAQLAEREGLVGKLCLPNTLRGLLSWREGEFDASVRLFTDAHHLAERIGWSEVSFSALLGLAAARRDQGELGGAREALTRALTVCERAGLTTQSIQAHAALTLVCMLADDQAGAEQAAEQAATLASQVRNPVGEAAALEARGIVEEPPEAFDTLRQAGEAWDGLGRRLEAARCQQLLGRRLTGVDPGSGAERLAQAAATYDDLGITHLAHQARVLAGV
jgi:tetratricopeptide (TPR) repeat protein